MKWSVFRIWFLSLLKFCIKFKEFLNGLQSRWKILEKGIKETTFSNGSDKTVQKDAVRSTAKADRAQMGSSRISEHAWITIALSSIRSTHAWCPGLACVLRACPSSPSTACSISILFWQFPAFSIIAADALTARVFQQYATYRVHFHPWIAREKRNFWNKIFDIGIKSTARWEAQI